MTKSLQFVHKITTRQDVPKGAVEIVVATEREPVQRIARLSLSQAITVAGWMNAEDVTVLDRDEAEDSQFAHH